MTQAEFVRRVVAMEDTLYRVSTTLLPQLCDRQDAVQSAIEKALRKREKLRDPNALEAWLTRILINECYLILRSRKRETPMNCSRPLRRNIVCRWFYITWRAIP